MCFPARRADRRGTTLLECEVAMLVLGLLMLGLVRLVTSHERIVASLDPWPVGEVVLRVERPPVPLERTLGAPARLLPVSATPARSAAAAANGSHRLIVLETGPGTVRSSWRAVIRREEIEP